MISELHEGYEVGADGLEGYVPDPLTEADGPGTALIIGRFQPLHEGHRAGLLDPALDAYEAVVVGIGVSGDEPTAHDPLTYEEREEVIDAVYGDTDAVSIVPIEDQGDDAVWIDAVEERVAEYVRELMTEGEDDWRERVPAAAVPVLESYGIEQRLQGLVSPDEL